MCLILDHTFKTGNIILYKEVKSRNINKVNMFYACVVSGSHLLTYM